ncbi:MAG: hypothetical protein U0325_19190 [Polyangiales bacterium]
MNAHPELTFELANLITPDAHEAPTRFVLSTDLMPPLLTAWLLPGRALARARRAYDARSWGPRTRERPHGAPQERLAPRLGGRLEARRAPG